MWKIKTRTYIIIAMSKKLIIANWKMNPSSAEEAAKIFSAANKSAKGLKKVETVICPPSVYLESLGHQMSKLELGAQDVFYQNGSNAHTGEVSAKMLKNLGVKYVIAGHSERRAMGETDEVINKKITSALSAGLKVVFCVGEKERDLSGHYFAYLKDQLDKGLCGISSKMLKNVIIVYEPVWAISGNPGASPDDPQSTFKSILLIKKWLVDFAGGEIGRNMPIIYGGSVDSQNAQEFLEKGGAGGLLVGRSSLNTQEFGKILKITEEIKNQ